MADRIESNVAFTGGSYHSVKAVTTTYTALSSDQLLLADSTAGAFTITLPPIADAYQLLDADEGYGQELIIVLDTDGGDLTVDADGSETINGSANVVLDDAGDVLTIRATASEWTIVKAAGSLTADLGADCIDGTKLADDAVDSEHIAADALDSEHYAAGSIDAEHMSTGGDDWDQGHACAGYFYLTSTAADTETVTINSRVYEFDTDSSTTGDVDVDISGDATADAACTALAAAINGDGSADVDAVVMAGNADTNAGVMLIDKTVSGSNYSLATTCANGVVSAAALTGGGAVADTKLFPFAYTTTAADVTQWATAGGNSVAVAGFPSTSQPTLNSFVVTTSGGWTVPVVTVVFTWLQANSNYWLLVCDDAAATITAGDVISGLCTV